VKRSLAIVVTAIALVSCTRVASAPGNLPSGHSWTQQQTLRVGAYEEPDSLDPVVTTMAFAGDVFQLLYDGLIRYDDRGRAVPDLAVAVPSRSNGGISPDGMMITYHLAPNARWSDGVPVTARDVVFTYRAIMNPANNVASRVGYDRIRTVRAIDALTVRVELARPYAPAVYLFRDLSPGAILPEHVLGGYRDLNRIPFNVAPIGSGPYVLREWLHGSEMRFAANPHYFRGAPKIKDVVFKFIPDQNTLISQLQTHEIDLAYDLPASRLRQLAALDGVRTVAVSTLHWEHMSFNVRHPPLDDRSVRLALCYGYDEQAVYDKIYHRAGTMGPTDQNPDYGWYDPRLRYYPHDVGRAGGLLEAAGWRLSADGYRYKEGRRLETTISTVAGVANREAIEVMLQEQWRRIGVHVEIKNFPAPTLFAPAAAGGMLYGGRTDITIFSWLDATPDPDDEAFVGPRELPPNGQNVSFYVNPRIGRDQEAALRTNDPAQRRRYYYDVQRILMADVPQYTFDWTPEIDAANVDLRGLRPVPVGSDFWNIADWTL
jgi:peptide/nickel transport system substrate-binding protein